MRCLGFSGERYFGRNVQRSSHFRAGEQLPQRALVTPFLVTAETPRDNMPSSIAPSQANRAADIQKILSHCVQPQTPINTRPLFLFLMRCFSRGYVSGRNRQNLQKQTRDATHAT